MFPTGDQFICWSLHSINNKKDYHVKVKIYLSAEIILEKEKRALTFYQVFTVLFLFSKQKKKQAV